MFGGVGEEVSRTNETFSDGNGEILRALCRHRSRHILARGSDERG